MNLVNTPDASTFMQRMGTDVGRRAFLGDKAKYTGSVINHIGYAHNAMIGLVTKIAELVHDTTRPSDPEKHDAARTLATKAANVLGQSQAGFKAAASELANEAGEIIKATFKADPDRQFIYSETVSWLREQFKTVEGMAKVQADLRDDLELATVIAVTPGRLMNLDNEVRRKMFDRAIERFAPAAYAKLEQSAALSELADSYTKRIQEVYRHSFNPAVADQIARRVEV